MRIEEQAEHVVMGLDSDSCLASHGHCGNVNIESLGQIY